ncbi:MAG: hypothetical protein ABEJ28_08610 [Salinigranum sp.]
MCNPTLTESDLAALVELEARPADLAALAAAVDVVPERLEERLAFMADNGLLRIEGGRYRLSDDGRRVIRAPGDGSADDGIDLPESVVWALQARGLRAARLDAVLSAYAFLRFWGTATAAEIVDGTFSEAPLEYDTAAAWWTDLVRDHLASLPAVEPPAEEGGLWRVDGTPDIDGLSADGRRVLFDRGRETGRYSSAREAADDLGLSDGERLSVSAALAVLQRGDEVDGERLRTAAASVDAGDVPGAAWLDEGLFAALERLPGVVRDGDRWRYALTPDGYESDA